MDYNDSSNPNSYHPKITRMIKILDKIALFCFLIPFIAALVFLILKVVGIFDFIPDDPFYKIFGIAFAGFFVLFSLFVSFIIFIVKLTKKKELEAANMNASPQPFQSYPNQPD